MRREPVGPLEDLGDYVRMDADPALLYLVQGRDRVIGIPPPHDEETATVANGTERVAIEQSGVVHRVRSVRRHRADGVAETGAAWHHHVGPEALDELLVLPLGVSDHADPAHRGPSDH